MYKHRRPSINGHRGELRGEHVLVAEKALGKPLPLGAIVHHVDGDGANNAHSNLVVCPDQGYHQLLHLRQRALAACGHADWVKCQFCKGWDDPGQMYTYVPKGYQQPRGWHVACQREYQRVRSAAGVRPNRDGSRGGVPRGRLAD